MERNAVALFCERTGERAAVLAQNGEIVRACAVRQSKGRGEPPHRDPGGDSEIMPFGKLGKRPVVLPEVQRRAVKALAVAVPGAVDTALKDVRRAEILELLGVGREQQRRARVAVQKAHIQLTRGLAEYLRQASRAAGRREQADAVQTEAVHQRAAVKRGNAVRHSQLLERAAVVERITADGSGVLRQRHCADAVRFVHGERAAAGHAHGKRVPAGEVGGAAAQDIPAERGDGRAVDLVGQQHDRVACLAPQDAHPLRLRLAGEDKFVFAVDAAHGYRSFAFFSCKL